MKANMQAVALLAMSACAAGAYLQFVWPDAREPASAPSPAPAESRRLPVLLIHGSGLDSSSWDALTRHLRASGWPDEYLMTVDLRPNNGANVEAAQGQLLPAARLLLARAAARERGAGRHPPAKLAIIGHSMGAVSGRWLAAKLIPGHVAVFIGIAGAHHGTNAVCGLEGAGNDELCPAFPAPGQSPVLDQLNGTPDQPLDPTPFGVAADAADSPSVRPTADHCISWYSLSIDPDEWIAPAASARLPGSGGAEPAELPSGIVRIAAGEFRLEDRVRHDDLPAAPAVMSWVTSLLRLAGSCTPV